MYYHLVKQCDVPLWGVSPEQRIAKNLRKIGAFEQLDDLRLLQPDDAVLILRLDYLYDAYLLSKIISQTHTSSSTLLTDSSDDKVVAAWTSAAAAPALLARIEKEDSAQEIAQEAGEAVSLFSPEALTGGYDPKLRKFNLSHVVKVVAEDQVQIENYLYDKSYKGITDFVTKWLWPAPARWVVRRCVEMNISPNKVTSFGWILTVIAGVLFYQGQFALGLLAAWLMTFLDTVDGKLARVSLQSSKLGHWMDHGLDIIHPPIWFWCWAMGLGLNELDIFGRVMMLDHLLIVMLLAYVGGRLFEGLFQISFDNIEIFCWKPIDAYHRLFTARRNPCIVLLSIALYLMSAEAGFIWVVLWSALSTILLALRFIHASFYRLFIGRLRPWIEDVDAEQAKSSRVIQWFTGRQADTTIASLIKRPNRR